MSYMHLMSGHYNISVYYSSYRKTNPWASLYLSL